MAVRFIYGQEQYLSGFGGASHYALASGVTEVTGFGVVRAIDGSYYTLWRTDAGDQTTGIILDRGASPYDYADSLGVAIFNHNIYTAAGSGKYLNIVVDTTAAFSTPTTVCTDLNFADDLDVAAEIDTSSGTTWANERYMLLQFVWGGSGNPTADVDIGQVVVGKFLELDVDPAPFSTIARIGSVLLSSGYGTDAAVALGRRYLDFQLTFDNVSAAELASLEAVVSAQEGALRPFALVTHRATASDFQADDVDVLQRWSDPWMCRFLDDGWQVDEVEGNVSRYSVSIPVRRYMKDTDL